MDSGQVDSSAEPETESRQVPGRRATGRQLGPSPSPSPLDALLAMFRRSWEARSCGPSWMCKLLNFARMLTEPLGGRGRRRAPPDGDRA